MSSPVKKIIKIIEKDQAKIKQSLDSINEDSCKLAEIESELTIHQNNLRDMVMRLCNPLFKPYTVDHMPIVHTVKP